MKTVLLLAMLLAGDAKADWNRFISQMNIFSGEVASNLAINAPLSVSSTGKVTTGLITLNATATSTATTTSTTDVAMTTMTVTPLSGTHFCIFTGVVQQNSAGNSATLSFYVGGTQDTTSIMDAAPFDGGTLSAGSASAPYVTHGVYTVNGSQAIVIQWHVSGGTGSVFQRKLTCVKIG